MRRESEVKRQRPLLAESGRTRKWIPTGIAHRAATNPRAMSRERQSQALATAGPGKAKRGRRPNRSLNPPSPRPSPKGEGERGWNGLGLSNPTVRISEAKLENKTARTRRAVLFSGVPTGIRTPVIAVKGRCPRPLDDGDKTSRK